MKKVLAFLFFFFLIVGCKNVALEDTFIYFSEPQPVNVAAVNSFPEKYVRTYTKNYANRLVVEPKCIYTITIETATALKSELDSIPDIRFQNNKIIDTKSNQVYTTFVRNDTIQWEIPQVDTIFSFAEGEVAKIYKSSLILNKEEHGKFVTNIIHLHSFGTTYTQFGTKKDFYKIESQLKIPYESRIEGKDTSYVLFSPSRADFRKLLRMEGFDFEGSYLLR